MPRAPTVRAADLDRALKALAKNGLTVARVEVRPGGEVVIVPRPAPDAEGSQPAITPAEGAEDLTPEGPPAEVSDLDRFREEKRRRGVRAAEGS